MGPDYDDVGAIAILHALEANGECEILATVASDAHPDIAPTIEVFNTYFGRKDIPIGIAPSSAPNFTAGNNWNEKLIDKFQPEIKNKTYPDAVDVYRKVLSEQPDQSVTIVSVGFISNLAALLDSEPDDYSDLNGLELVEKKVKKWVAMAGSFPEGKEFNVFKDAPASYSTFQNWPTPILFSGFEIGSKIMTGNKVAKEKNINKACPIQWAYEYNLKTYAKKEVKNRASWDQTAVLCAVRNPSDYFYVNGPGAFLIEENGSNNWDPDTDNQHTFLVHKYPYQVIADEIESLMLYKPSMK
ncbi:nucleoside hydrolase [Portibacter lacus]|uniref:Nucleoside hydrolase n=2 Tax=Portibacter lacus TaxID=1099794 RepID=A0AA37SUS3_9BACT|nr:nucleoside hydrolase [Portibacter lacus]